MLVRSTRIDTVIGLRSTRIDTETALRFDTDRHGSWAQIDTGIDTQIDGIDTEIALILTRIDTGIDPQIDGIDTEIALRLTRIETRRLGVLSRRRNRHWIGTERTGIQPARRPRAAPIQKRAHGQGLAANNTNNTNT
jgi:hypothetical protein